jgi:Predicted nucleotide-binding protein containing TIR-like domain
MRLQFTIFYSWQSDLDSKHNRNFILGALEKAVKDIGHDDRITLDAVVDRDTFGLPGSPSIVESITAKIAKSDLFIADVSITNNNQALRPSPNPNVIFELGYASAILGWDRIVLIQNSSYGGPERLPFDLRGRRVMTYTVDDATKASQKQKLRDDLVATFTDILRYAHNSQDIKERLLWWGTWEKKSKSTTRSATLRISRVSSEAFFFKIKIYDGARSGIVQGRASILTPHSAYARVFTSETQLCELSFQRHLRNDRWQIAIIEGDHCRYFHGEGVSFSGTYLHSSESSADLGYLSEIDFNELERMTGQYLPVLLNNFQIVQQDIYREEWEIYTVLNSFVRGLYYDKRTVIVLTDTGKVWCAGIDPDQKVIRYFYNTPTDIRPPIIASWLELIPAEQVIVNDPGEPMSPY